MPKISEFFGISIYIYYRDHLPSHFHAIYGGEEAAIAIDNLSVLSGRLTPRTMGLVVEWASLHQDKLRHVWEQAKSHEVLEKIEPLKQESFMHKIVAVQPLPQYKVRVSFSDGIEGEVDLSDLVGKGVFVLWDDPAQFAKVSIDPQTHTLTWPGGIDICPDTLYQDVMTTKAAAPRHYSAVSGLRT